MVNNAGILRDRMLVNITEKEWRAVTRVHLKSTFAMTDHAANHWRLMSKKGEQPEARVINATSHSGLFRNIGQATYAAAKVGIDSFLIVAARELRRYGVDRQRHRPARHDPHDRGFARMDARTT